MSYYRRLSMILIVIASLLALLPLAQLHAQGDIPTGSVAVVRGQGALLLDDSAQQMKAALTAGALVVLIGRSADGGMLYVESGSSGDGWVAAGSLLTATIADLPLRAVGSNAAAASQTASEGQTGITVTQSITPITVTQGITSLTVTQSITPAAPLAAQSEGLLPTPTPEANLLTMAAEIVGRVTLTDSRLNLRSGPGTLYPIVAKAAPSSLWQIVGRNETSDWLQVTDAANNPPAWAAASYLDIISGTLDAATVIVELPPVPTATATPLGAPDLSEANGPSSSDSTQSELAAGGESNSVGPVGKTGLAGTLVFQDRNGGTIYVYDLGTDTLRALTGGIDPAISNDGRLVTFARDGGDAGLYVINLDGSGERLLYNERDIIRSPKWSPDDQWVVFSRSNGYHDCRALQGGVCVPDDTIWDSLPKQFQSGASHNAIKDLPNQREYFFALARIGVDGQNYRDIPALTKAQAPDWNEAGITYFSSMAGIQITQDDGNAKTVEVANDAILGYFEDPDWQPGGGRIAFQRQMNGQHWQIFVVNPDGTGQAALTQPVTALVDELPSSVSPAWSPDGQHIVYLSNRSSIESAGAWHLWVMNADGSDQHMLPVDVPLDYTFSAEQMVSWGPAL